VAFVPEGAGLVRGAVPDDHELGAEGMEAVEVAGERADLLAAEDSTKVADEHEHDGAVAPEGGEGDLGAGSVEDGERGEIVSERHVGSGSARRFTP